MKEYKIVIFKESSLGSILLGGSKMNPEKFATFLNIHAAEGWRVVTIEKEIRRTYIFWGLCKGLCARKREKELKNSTLGLKQ